MEPAESSEPVQEPAPLQPEVVPLRSVLANRTVESPLGSPSSEAIQPYDFRRPAFSPTELRKLRLWHEEFLRSLAARLSIYLRLSLNLRMSKLQTLTYHKWIEGLANPTYLTLFKAEPLRGVCVLDLPPRLGLTLVDRLLGGQAQAVVSERDLSEIEVALLDQAIQLVLDEWSGLWKQVPALRPAILGHETNGQFLQMAPPDTLMLALSAEARLGDCVEQMQLAFPCSTLEPLISRLKTPLDPAAVAPVPVGSPTVLWNHTLDEVKMPMTAEWHGMEITVREVTQLKAGDVLELSPNSVNQVRLQLADTAKFLGRLGTRDRRWGVEITQVLKSERPV